MDATPLAPATIHSYQRTISSILERAVKWKCIPSNPAERAELLSLAGHEARYLDGPDAKRMLQLLQDEPIKWRAPIIFDLLSGLRRAELLGLRWQDVNLADGVVHIVQTSNYVSGKGVYVSTPQQVLSNRLETLAIYVYRGSISRIEDKQRTVTDIELYGLAKILDVPIESLFGKIED